MPRTQLNELVQKLATAVLARELGRDELADANVREALELAKALATAEIEASLSLR